MKSPKSLLIVTGSLFLVTNTACTLQMHWRGEEKKNSESVNKATTENKTTEKKEEKAAATATATTATPPAATTNTATPAKPQETTSAAAPAPKPEDKKAPEKKKEGEKSYEEVIKDKEKISGLFTIYKDKDKLYFSILPDQLEKNYLVLQSLTQGVGERGLIGGLPGDSYVLRMEKRDEKIFWTQINTSVTAPKDTPAARSMKYAFSDSPFASFKIEATDTESKAMLIDAQPLFLSDFPGLGEWLKGSLGTDYGLKKDMSYIAEIRNFPKNLEMELSYAFESRRYGNADTIPDSRYVRLGLHYSFAELAADSTFRPRIADDRVGHFLVARKSFDSKREADRSFDRYIIRWNLEKADPTLAVSPVKKPITFYIENTTPYEHRDAVKEGILLWNKAFEAAGFKDAVQAVVMPDDADWHPADLRYNVVRWINSSSGSFAGIGPARVNPLTGEIVDADVLIEGESIRNIRRYFDRYVQPVSTTSFQVLPDKNGEFACSMAEGKASEANFALLAMLVRGDMKAGDPVPESFVHGYIVDLVAHEVGHVLGLRHNFKSSAIHPVEKLHDKQLTQSIGLVGSVMDYNGINVAPAGIEQGEYFPTTVGPYDVWAIQYAYTPISNAKTSEEELPELQKIASRSAEPHLLYGTDEDAFGISPIGIDPRTMHWDLGAEPLTFSKQQMKLIEEQMQKFAPMVVKEGEAFTTVRHTLSGLLGMYARDCMMACKYIGGIYMERNHKGDAGAKAPFTPVAAAKQREALDFLTRYVFSNEAFQFSPELLRQLAPERWMHWGMGGWTTEIDFPLHDRVLGIQKSILGWLFQPMVLRRVVDSEMKFATGEEAFTMPEIFQKVEKSIWGDLRTPVAVEASANRKATNQEDSSFRRALQREHVQALIGILHEGAEVLPEDARTQAWASLNRIVATISKQSTMLGLEGYSGPHLRETEARIRKALDAHMSVSTK